MAGLASPPIEAPALLSSPLLRLVLEWHKRPLNYRLCCSVFCSRFSVSLGPPESRVMGLEKSGEDYLSTRHEAIQRFLANQLIS
jgi:hypothetical protein